MRTTFLITSGSKTRSFHNSPTLFTQRWQILNAERLGEGRPVAERRAKPNALIPRVIKLHAVVIIRIARLRLPMSLGKKGSVAGYSDIPTGSGFHWCQIQGAGKPGDTSNPAIAPEHQPDKIVLLISQPVAH
ncbi:hypothetical protein KCP76_21220 [Salmonella enterica subsp. enterica serovar Weltevreden]|nr:hypothetical protein KCP76_21220 [Salmonella enterica subsp. enterica serovar Weltevreden]